MKPEARRVLEMPDGSVIEQEIEMDEIAELLQGGEDASVSATIGYAYQPYAPGKVSVHISSRCAQDTTTIDRAAHILLRMARDFALDGMDMIREDVESGRFNIGEEVP